MLFTPLEMASQYRQCKDKQAQIKVFMECNQLTEEQVIDILKSEGVTAQQLPRKTIKSKKSKTVEPQEVADIPIDCIVKDNSIVSQVRQGLIEAIQHQIQSNTARYINGKTANTEFVLGIHAGLSLAMSIVLFNMKEDGTIDEKG